MPHQNTVFHALTKHIPWDEFERIVDEHQSDFRVRRLDTRSQFLAMLYAQLSGASSLREIEAGLKSHKSSLYHVGAKPALRSTLSDANALRPWEVFGDLFACMVAKASRRTRRNLADVTRIIDATKVKLPPSSPGWPQVSEHFCGAKVHIVYDPDEALPLKADITPDNVNDITPAKALDIEPGATYVFDMGYYDFGWWARLDAHGCCFVTRLKSHTRLTETARLDAPKGTNILSDHIGLLPKRLARSRKNPFADPVREITVRISTGKIIRIVTNDLDAPAEEIADLYKQRWQIELFFKWIKQNLKIRRFVGVSGNAVRIQVFTALIAYLLLRIIQETQSSVKSASTFAHLICLNLMHKRPLDNLCRPYIPPPPDPRQVIMEFGSC
jgi:hypothetical protein